MTLTFEEAMKLTRTVSSNAAFEDAECEEYFKRLMEVPRGNATIVEIGLQYGRSSSIALQVAKEHGLRYVGIDSFNEAPGILEAWIQMSHRVDGVDKRVHIMRSDGFNVDFPISAILVDADHYAPAVKSDCEHYMPHVIVGGVAMFHDYGVESLPEVRPEVRAYFEGRPEWTELPTVGCLGVWRRVE